MLLVTSAEVLTTSIDVRVVFAVTNALYNEIRDSVQASPDGLARGLYYIVGADYDGDEELRIRKFSIDATGERCVGVTGHPHLH